MRTLFDIDVRAMRRFEKLMKRIPKELTRATAGMLNSFAFGTRAASLQIIQRRMIVRNPRFVKSSIRVDKARGGMPINRQRSEAGSIQRARFSGWREQETGESSNRRRVAELFARGGDKRRQVRPSLRMKSANQFMSPDDFRGKTQEHRVIVMLQILERKRWRRPFIIRDHPKFTPGLYKFHRRKLRMVQTFKPGNREPKRVRWMTGGRRLFFRQANIKQLWTQNLQHTIRKARRK